MVDADIVPMGEIIGLLVIAVENIGERRGYVACAVFLGEALRVGNVFFLIDSSIFAHLHVFPCAYNVHVIMFA